MLGTAVGRAIAMQAHGNTLCPNMFIGMVGGPGTGKSQTVRAMRSIFIKAHNAVLMPASVTRAALEDYMFDNLASRFAPDGTQILTNECIALTEEMQGILPDQDLSHLTLYNILYDLPSNHKARTRTNGEVKLELPYCSIFTGAQPAYLATVMPENAWGMGFMSRMLMAFDVKGARKSAFVDSVVDHELQAALIHDLRQISQLKGWMKWDQDAMDLYEQWWVKEGGPPVPTQKRLIMGYNARREIHFFKLAMMMSLSRGNDLRVTFDDAVRAITTLLDFEAVMKHIFTEMSTTGATVALQDILDIVRANSAAGKLTDESMIITLLMQRLPQSQVHSTVENLIASKALLVKGGIDARGFRKFDAGVDVPLG